MASDGIQIRDVPGYIRLPDGRTVLADWLSELDRIADGGNPNGVFTPENFDYFAKQDLSSLKRTFPRAIDLKRFQSFAHFRQYLEKYIESKRCDDPKWTEEAKKAKKNDGPNWVCIAPPEPKIPPVNVPPVVPLKPRPAQRKKIDTSAFSSDYPKWFDDEKPFQSSPIIEQPVEPLQSLGETIAGRYSSPFEKMKEDIPDISDPTKPQMKVSFDGKHFIVDFHGCHVDSVESRNCIADWVHFILSLTNVSSGRHVSKTADIRGFLRVRIEAKKGETVKVYGADPGDGTRSINTVYYHIDKDGRVTQDETICSEGQCEKNGRKNPSGRKAKKEEISCDRNGCWENNKKSVLQKIANAISKFKCIVTLEHPQVCRIDDDLLRVAGEILNPGGPIFEPYDDGVHKDLHPAFIWTRLIGLAAEILRDPKEWAKNYVEKAQCFANPAKCKKE